MNIFREYILKFRQMRKSGNFAELLAIYWVSIREDRKKCLPFKLCFISLSRKIHMQKNYKEEYVSYPSMRLKTYGGTNGQSLLSPSMYLQVLP